MTTLWLALGSATFGVFLSGVSVGMVLMMGMFWIYEKRVGKPARKQLGELNRELGRVEARNEVK